MICPYREKNRRICTHKLCKLNKAKKRLCLFKFPHNCPIFVDWVELNKKEDSEGLKTSKNTT